MSKTFGERIKEKKKESKKTARMMDWQLSLYERIKRIIPDITGTWSHGCISRHEFFDSPIFYAESVAKNWTEISLGSLGCCHENYDNPYYARAIQLVEGQRVRANCKVCVARYDGWGDGYRPEDGWEKEIEKKFGKNAIKTVRDFLDKNPYVEPEDYDEDEDY